MAEIQTLLKYSEGLTTMYEEEQYLETLASCLVGIEPYLEKDSQQQLDLLLQRLVAVYKKYSGSAGALPQSLITSDLEQLAYNFIHALHYFYFVPDDDKEKQKKLQLQDNTSQNAPKVHSLLLSLKSELMQLVKERLVETTKLLAEVVKDPTVSKAILEVSKAGEASKGWNSEEAFCNEFEGYFTTKIEEFVGYYAWSILLSQLRCEPNSTNMRIDRQLDTLIKTVYSFLNHTCSLDSGNRPWRLKLEQVNNVIAEVATEHVQNRA